MIPSLGVDSRPKYVASSSAAVSSPGSDHGSACSPTRPRPSDNSPALYCRALASSCSAVGSLIDLAAVSCLAASDSSACRLAIISMNGMVANRPERTSRTIPALRLAFPRPEFATCRAMAGQDLLRASRMIAPVTHSSAHTP